MSGRLNGGQIVAAICGAALLALMFSPWYSLPGDGGLSAWESFGITDVLLAIAALIPLAVAFVALTRLSVSLPVAGNAIAALIAIAALVCVVYRVIDPVSRAGVELDRDLGLFLGLAAVAGVTLGSYRAMEAN